MLQPDRATSFDKVGHGYRQYRTTDPFIFGMIEEVLGDSITVLNCGAGASSYEAPHRRIIGGALRGHDQTAPSRSRTVHVWPG
jgi:hypothetical protein